MQKYGRHRLIRFIVCFKLARVKRNRDLPAAESVSVLGAKYRGL